MNLVKWFKNEKLIFIDEKFNNKNEVLNFVSKELLKNNFTNNSDKIYSLFREREREYCNRWTICCSSYFIWRY